MAERNAPYGPWTMGQTPGMGAEAEREMLASLLTLSGAGTLGTISQVVHAGTDLIVTASSTPDSNVHVSAGQIFIAGSQGANQGAYHGSNDASGRTLAVAAADASFPRHDLVVATMIDPDYLGGSPANANHFLLQVITGTPSATPADPALPPSSIALARLNIPAISSGPTNVQASWITDLRPVPGFTKYTPNWTAISWGGTTGGPPSIGNGVLGGFYCLAGRMMDIYIVLVVGSTTDGGSGSYLFGLPPGLAAPPIYQYVHARLFASDGNIYVGDAELAPNGQAFQPEFSKSPSNCTIGVLVQSNSLSIGRSPDTGGASWPIAVGSQIILQGRIQVA